MKQYPQIIYKDGHGSEHKRVDSAQEERAVREKWGQEIEPEKEPEAEPEKVSEILEEAKEKAPEPEQIEAEDYLEEQKEEAQQEESEQEGSEEEKESEEELKGFSVRELKDRLIYEFEFEEAELKQLKKKDLIELILEQ